jgi:hypothetical protein
MKKSTKSEKPAAPQVKSVIKNAVEPSPVKKTVAPKKIATPKKAVALAPVVVPASPAIPVAATPSPAADVRGATTIVAQVDVGFGNHLFIRGEGPGLSWERGALMTCVADNRWSYSIPSATRKVTFKLLVNDMTWSGGEDFSAAPGATAVVHPSF